MSTGALNSWRSDEASSIFAIVRHDLSPVVFTLEAAEALAARAEALGRTVRAWVKVDTGLGRIGVLHADAPNFARRIAKHPRLQVAGLLSTMTENPERHPLQGGRLIGVRAALPEPGALPLSLASTDRILSHPASLLGVVPRAPAPDAGLARRMDPRPVVTWKARVAYVKRIPRRVVDAIARITSQETRFSNRGALR